MVFEVCSRLSNALCKTILQQDNGTCKQAQNYKTYFPQNVTSSLKSRENISSKRIDSQ